MIDDEIFKNIMLVIIPLTAFYVLFKKDIAPSGQKLEAKKAIPLCMLVAFVIGILVLVLFFIKVISGN